MKRSGPMRRTSFGLRPRKERNVFDSDEKTNTSAEQVKPAATLRKGVYGPAELRPAPKPETPRNPDVLALAKGRRCLLMAVENCRTLDGSTTVACHENQGKGMGIKQSDARSVWGCFACHFFYDSGSVPRAEKRRAFEAAYQRQMEEWKAIANDPRESPKARKAAQWALDHAD